MAKRWARCERRGPQNKFHGMTHPRVMPWAERRWTDLGGWARWRHGVGRAWWIATPVGAAGRLQGFAVGDLVLVVAYWRGAWRLATVVRASTWARRQARRGA